MRMTLVCTSANSEAANSKCVDVDLYGVLIFVIWLTGFYGMDC